MFTFFTPSFTHGHEEAISEAWRTGLGCLDLSLPQLLYRLTISRRLLGGVDTTECFLLRTKAADYPKVHCLLLVDCVF